MKQATCPANLIPPYLEGELDQATTELLEEHLQGCELCRIELRAHQLFMCELDAALTQQHELDVPANFSHLVAVRAVSDMRGVRSASEHKKALAFCLALALISFALLGTTARDYIVRFGRKLFGVVWGLADFLWNAAYDTVASLTVVSKALSRKFVVESGSLIFVLVVLAAGGFLLSRLISNYHRSGATE